MQSDNLHTLLAQDRADEAAGDAKPSFLKRLSAAVSQVTTCGPLEYMTTLHSCFVNGKRTLVHRRGLKTVQPGVFQRLKQYAVSNGFTLLEDRRKRQLECRDERRRMAPVLMFAAGLVSASAVAEDGGLNEGGVSVIPTIDVVAQREQEQRPYLIEAGKRFVSQPYGEVELILGVAAEVRLHGEKRRIRTRGVEMPSEYAPSFVDRYDYTLPGSCGGQTFSYYEGDGFAALGYHAEQGKVILDVLAGGGPFTGPRLWGAYDQVLNSNVRMDLMFGGGKKDGMGLLKASYKIGLMPVMRTGSKDYYGELYSHAVAKAAACEPTHIPGIRHADSGEEKFELDDAS